MFPYTQRRRQDFESDRAKGRPGKKVTGHYITIKYAKLHHFSFHGLFCIFQKLGCLCRVTCTYHTYLPFSHMKLAPLAGRFKPNQYSPLGLPLSRLSLILSPIAELRSIASCPPSCVQFCDASNRLRLRLLTNSQQTDVSLVKYWQPVMSSSNTNYYFLDAFYR